MLAAAAETVAALAPDAAARMRLVEVDGVGAGRALGGERFDAVLCHGVVMYLDDPLPLLRALVDLARPGGIVSIVAKNAGALAMRAGMQGRWTDALAAVDATSDIGGVGVRTRGDDPDGLAATMADLGCELVGWYGVRLFTDHLTGVPTGPDAADAIALEDACARRDPYRRMSRLLHLICCRSNTVAG